MKSNYKGYEIIVERDNSMSGYDAIFYSVFRKADGLEIICNQTYSDDTVYTIFQGMKDRVDEFIETKGDSELLSDKF